MASIIKRRKTANYTQINNLPIQQDLNELAAIGLLSYMMSLPEDWQLRKSHLHNQFSRRRVDNAWKVLVEKHYIIGFYCHVDGKRYYFYNVSDLPFTQFDFDVFVLDVLDQLKEDGKSVTNIIPIKDQFFNPSIVQNVQYKMSSTKRTTTKEIETKETDTNKHSLTIVNKESLTSICNQFYTEFALGRWSKKEWNTIVNKFTNEVIECGKHKRIARGKLTGYIYQSLKNISKRHDFKYSNEFADRRQEFEEIYGGSN